MNNATPDRPIELRIPAMPGKTPMRSNVKDLTQRAALARALTQMAQELLDGEMIGSADPFERYTVIRLWGRL